MMNFLFTRTVEIKHLLNLGSPVIIAYIVNVRFCGNMQELCTSVSGYWTMLIATSHNIESCNWSTGP